MFYCYLFDVFCNCLLEVVGWCVFRCRGLVGGCLLRVCWFGWWGLFATACVYCLVLCLTCLVIVGWLIACGFD